MKKFLNIILCIIITVPLVSGRNDLLTKNKIRVKESRWTGQITMEEKVTISSQGWTAESKRNVQASFINTLPTLYRDSETTDLNFTDDKGPGFHSFHSESILGGRSCVTDCQSTDKAELHQVVVDEENNTYDIEVISPMCKGTTCADQGGVAPYEETVSVLVLDHPLGTNKDLLAGTKTETGDVIPGISTFTRTISWHFERTSEADVELIVMPANYNTWLPEPNLNLETPGTIMNVSLKLQGKNGTTTNKKAKYFKLHLSNTSREPGLTINFPLNNADDSPDLKFMQQSGAVITDEEYQSMVIQCNPSRQTADFKIGAFDGGGWSILNAEAVLEDNSTVQGRLLVSNGEQNIRIPKRDPNSKIAEAWLKVNSNPGEMDDIETTKGNINEGDGLTAYEEYRGVISEGKFKRLKPDKKELGIKIKRAEFSLFTEAFQWFEAASEVKIILFYENEISRDRRLNKNAKSAHDYDQYALRVEKRNLPRGTLGTVYNGPDIPSVVDPVVFDWAQIQAAYQRRANEANPERLKFTVREYLAQTVAHEIGHAVNIWHHGNAIRLEPYDAATESYIPITVTDFSDRLRIFDRRGNLITSRPFTLWNVGGTSGTVESGDLTCMLNYYPYYRWGYTTGADGARIYNQEPLIPLGKLFCKSDVATGFNTTQLFFSNAARGKGNCLSQIKLR